MPACFIGLLLLWHASPEGSSGKSTLLEMGNEIGDELGEGRSEEEIYMIPQEMVAEKERRRKQLVCYGLGGGRDETGG